MSWWFCSTLNLELNWFCMHSNLLGIYHNAVAAFFPIHTCWLSMFKSTDYFYYTPLFYQSFCESVFVLTALYQRESIPAYRFPTFSDGNWSDFFFSGNERANFRVHSRMIAHATFKTLCDKRFLSPNWCFVESNLKGFPRGDHAHGLP